MPLALRPINPRVPDCRRSPDLSVDTIMLGSSTASHEEATISDLQIHPPLPVKIQKLVFTPDLPFQLTSLGMWWSYRRTQEEARQRADKQGYLACTQ